MASDGDRWTGGDDDVIGAAITVTPARTVEPRIFDRAGLCGGLCAALPDAFCYFAGDTGFARNFATVRARLGAPDVALARLAATIGCS